MSVQPPGFMPPQAFPAASAIPGFSPPSASLLGAPGALVDPVLAGLGGPPQAFPPADPTAALQSTSFGAPPSLSGAPPQGAFGMPPLPSAAPAAFSTQPMGLPQFGSSCRHKLDASA